MFGPALMALRFARIARRVVRGVEAGLWKVLTGGRSTPYTYGYSYEQTLVMQGRLSEALESYERFIAAKNSTVDVRIRAAEVYAREAKNHHRAVQLLQDVIRHPQCTPGEEVYAAHRLADLFSQHLGQPGEAMAQLRRLADRYPGTTTGQRARESIRALKSVTLRDDESAPGPAIGAG